MAWRLRPCGAGSPTYSTGRAASGDRESLKADRVSHEPFLRGRCGCGAVQFEISEPLRGAIYCHCGRCQKRTGTAYEATGKAAPRSVTVTVGAEHLRDWTPGGLAKVFCGLCGAHLFAREPGGGEIRAVRLAAIDGDPGVSPSGHQFVAYAASWQPLSEDGSPGFPNGCPAGDEARRRRHRPATS